MNNERNDISINHEETIQSRIVSGLRYVYKEVAYIPQVLNELRDLIKNVLFIEKARLNELKALNDSLSLISRDFPELMELLRKIDRNTFTSELNRIRTDNNVKEIKNALGVKEGSDNE